MELNQKKILLLSTSDLSGAYEAIYRLGNLFLSENHQVKMLVKNKTKSDHFIVEYKAEVTRRRTRVKNEIFQRIENLLFPKTLDSRIIFDDEYAFISKDEKESNINPEKVIELIGFKPDIILTGMTPNFLNSTDLYNLQKFTKAKVYNLAVDMNHFTGGCHYAWDCRGYVKGCDVDCPAIMSENGKYLAKENFNVKAQNALNGDFQIIGMSDWTINQAKESKIYKNQGFYFNVNSLIDTKLFNAKNRNIAKQVFDFSPEKFYILMGCQHTGVSRKGFVYLLESLRIFEKQLSVEQKNSVKVIIVSRNHSKQFDEIPFDKKLLDYIGDYRLLSLLYQASDVFVNSSIEDAGPMMVSEALACGTPVVGFDMGVVTNMVINNYNGYKATLRDSKDLANGINKIFSLSDKSYAEYSANAVTQVEKFSSMDYVKNVFDDIFKNLNY